MDTWGKFVLVFLIVLAVTGVLIAIAWSIGVRSPIKVTAPPGFSTMGLGMRCIPESDTPIIEGLPTSFVPQKCGDGMICEKQEPTDTYGKCLKRIGAPCNGIAECESSAVSCKGVCSSTNGGLNQSCYSTPCASGFTCVDGTCKTSDIGACQYNVDCASQWCNTLLANPICYPKKPNGVACSGSIECLSSNCDTTVPSRGNFCQDPGVSTGDFGAACALNLTQLGTAKCYPNTSGSHPVPTICVPDGSGNPVYGVCAQLYPYWPDHKGISGDTGCSSILGCVVPSQCYDTIINGNYCVMPRTAGAFNTNSCGVGTTGLCIPGYTCNSSTELCDADVGLPAPSGSKVSICQWDNHISDASFTYIGKWNNLFSSSSMTLANSEFSGNEFRYGTSVRKVYLLSKSLSGSSSIIYMTPNAAAPGISSFTGTGQLQFVDVYGSSSYLRDFTFIINIPTIVSPLSSNFFQWPTGPSNSLQPYNWVTSLAIRRAKFVPSGDLMLHMEAAVTFVAMSGATGTVKTGYVNFTYIVSPPSIQTGSGSFMADVPSAAPLILTIDDMFFFPNVNPTLPASYAHVTYTNTTYTLYNHYQTLIFASPSNPLIRYEIDGRTIDNRTTSQYSSVFTYSYSNTTLNVYEFYMLVLNDGTLEGINSTIKGPSNIFNTLAFRGAGSPNASDNIPQMVLPYIRSKAIDALDESTYYNFVAYTASGGNPNEAKIGVFEYKSGTPGYKLVQDTFDYTYPPSSDQGGKILGTSPAMIRYAMSSSLGTTPSQPSFVYLSKYASTYAVNIVSSRSDRILPGYFNADTLVCFTHRFMDVDYPQYYISEFGWTPSATVFTTTQ